MSQPKKVILFTLQTFSTTGGIQKMTRILSYSLNRLALRNNWDFKLWSVYDAPEDLMPQYLSPENFRGFKVDRKKFLLEAIFKRGKTDLIILTHINLAVIGLLIKLINPKTKVWLIAHGIEVWRPLSLIQKSFLKRCDKVICVSKFTRQQMISKQLTDADKYVVLNNVVDPFMKLPVKFLKPAHLLKRYDISINAPVIFTLTRLASSEQYKGHDQVIRAVSHLKIKFPDIKYILAGQYDLKEKLRIEQLVSEFKVQDHVIITGFIAEHELADHFLIAELFVLPSKKEGFGTVFIEALACGLPVICGNVDGSIDAICNGELGKAINPDNLSELECTLIDCLEADLTESKRQYLQQQCLMHFNENDYMNKLERLIGNE